MKKITESFTRLISRLSDAILRVPDIVNTQLRTASAYGQASLSDNVRVLSGGRIMNIYGDPHHIQIGFSSRIRGEVVTHAHAGRIKIGSWFYLGPNSMIWSSNETGITIGDRVLISANAMVHDTNSHPLDARARFEQTQQIFFRGHPRSITGINSAPITIGNDVWIGAGVTILKGVTIGDRAVIGTGSIICADVEADALIAAGTVLR